MHTLLHRYVAEQLAVTVAVSELQAAYGRYSTTSLRERGRGLRGSHQRDAWLAIEREMGSVLGAWQWAVALGPPGAMEDALPGLFTYHCM